jgi:hypothetical protein
MCLIVAVFLFLCFLIKEFLATLLRGKTDISTMVSNSPLSVAYATSFPQRGQESGL